MGERTVLQEYIKQQGLSTAQEWLRRERPLESYLAPRRSAREIEEENQRRFARRRELVSAGLTIEEMARTEGVTHQAIYEYLGRHRLREAYAEAQTRRSAGKSY